MKFKNSISPIIAVALLLIVTVIAVVTFQSWFGFYFSGVMADTETKSSKFDDTLIIDSLIGDWLYVINNIENDLEVDELRIESNVCSWGDNLSLGMNNVLVSDCVNNLNTDSPNVVLITNKAIVSKHFYIDNITGD